MVEHCRSITFFKNPDNALRIAKTARYFRCLPSEIIKAEQFDFISDADILDFDLGCAHILEQADNKRDFDRFKSLMLGLQTIAAGALGGEEAVKKMLAETENDEEIDDDEKAWET